MSIELPEARILAGQMDEALRGKQVRSYMLKDYEKLLRVGFINKNLGAFDGLVEDRLRMEGKDEFFDLHGKQGRYTPLMGPNMNGKICPRCGTKVEKISLGGGQIYYSPGCQK